VTANDDVTTLTCKLGAIPGGNHTVEVSHPEMGLATGSLKVTADIRIALVSPAAGSIMGGTLLTITGQGFGIHGVDDTITITDSSGYQVDCVPRTMINYHCAPYGRVLCHLERAYGYLSAAERHYVKHFDFSDDERIECQVQDSRRVGSKTRAADGFETRRQRDLTDTESTGTATKAPGASRGSGGAAGPNRGAVSSSPRAASRTWRRTRPG
jgi:hypothetical protein